MAISPLLTEKVQSPSAGDFSETVDFTVLHCANVTGNNNKFYCAEVQRNPNTNHFRIFTHYGRLSSTSVYEIRQQTKSGDHLDEHRARLEYDKIIKKKERGKTVKRGDEKIREYYTKVDVVSPSVGSNNIRNATDVVVSNNAPMVQTTTNDVEGSRIVRHAVAENIHNITNNTTMTFTSRGFETPLGPVTESHLDKASVALDVIRDELGSQVNMDDTQDVKDMNSEYYSLVPRKFGHRIGKSDLILTPDKLAQEYDLLDNLRTAVRAGLNTDDATDRAIDINIRLLDPSSPMWQEIQSRFERTKHSSHRHLHPYRVKTILDLDIPDITKRYQPTEARLGNVRELFHGTKTANMLSIMLNGLIIPPTGAAHVTGRMFGNGVYAASCSTKALNYATGYWGGSNNRHDTAFMLYVKFAMGKEFIASSHMYNGAPSGYDSVWGKAGRSLLNDEYIVYDLSQVTITHVIELEK